MIWVIGCVLAPVHLETTVSPYDVDREPPLAGTPTAAIPLDVDLSVLGRVNPDNYDDVFRHLAADPRWRVTEWQHVLVAFRRGEGSVARDGFLSAGDATWRTLFRFTGWDVGTPWNDSPLVARIPVDTAPVLRPFVLADGRVATATAFHCPDLTLEVYEAGKGTDRPHTRAAADEARALVTALLSDHDTIAKHGYDPSQMPPGEPRNGDPSLTVTSPGPGELEVSARLNPGRPGFAWVRLVRGKPWEEVAVAVGTREAVGWSTDSSEEFLMDGRFYVPKGPAFPARAEVWLQPPDADPIRIRTWAVQVPAR